ncbi:YeeE/YedE family protein [Pseudomonas arsenicoxydans]|uniref:YeeE/YedE family protein n=1 Tax=Pseudomonas arsenicoxydans TaxID=702115 RepID=A0A502HJG4_9PSED|nr:YeeE/YedE family protein [Pseudomonas arsenicoxydans]TPG73794.1 YeeE/YedE family protein [Pseudomonas arsenicoxydans]
MALFFAWMAGLIFGLGLLVSGMTNPAKVLGFLDVAGAWDPSLAFVMVGAIAVAAVSFQVSRTRTRSLLGLPINLPTARHIDQRLVIGSMLFGTGWGLAGICPGPALVLMGSGILKGAVFVMAMLAGMGLFERLERQKRPDSPGPISEKKAS